jgi:hypothetical protein
MVAFAFSSVIPVLSYISTVLIKTLNHEMWNFVFFSTRAVSFILSPLLLFASFYLIGRNVNLTLNFPSILASLFVGNLAGRSVVYLSLYGGSYVASSSFFDFLWLSIELLYMAFSLEFFVGFTALSMAYILKKRHTYEHHLRRMSLI